MEYYFPFRDVEIDGVVSASAANHSKADKRDFATSLGELEIVLGPEQKLESNRNRKRMQA